MVSAVFHSPQEASSRLAAAESAPASVSGPVSGPISAPVPQVKAQAAPPAQPKATRPPFDGRALWMRVLPPVLGLALMLGIWAMATQKPGPFPTPAATFEAAVQLFADPFYSKGPNDQGIGWNILFSLQRVALGFGLAAAVGIPLGFLIGRFEFASRMVSPLISLLKPVSPLAWLPIGLLVFKSANPAAIWTIFICSIWPMVVNTAVGVQRVPEDLSLIHI